MGPFRIGFVGTGPDPDDPGPGGYAMAYRHADAYRSIDGCELVACADIVPEHGEAFADANGIPETGIYTDHETMLAEADLDVVSVCTPPDVHEPIVVDCAGADLTAVHCEKPMADTWGAAKRMAAACRDNGVQLTFNHQRRFGKPFRQAKALLDEGEIGELEQVQFGAGNLYDYGSHSFDLCGYFADEAAPEWILAGLDYRTKEVYFGMHNANQAIAHWRYESGVQGMAATGSGASLVSAHHRLVGSDGVIEIGVDDGPSLRINRDSDAGWSVLNTEGEGVHGSIFIERALREVLRSVERGEPSTLRAENALRATELIFGAWESVRSRRRVDLPLEIEDNPLVSMIETGDLDPAPAE